METGHYLWIARDVTERRQLEERLVQSEKIESIGRLAGGIAHDFNNLLTAILGYTELVLGSRGDDDPNRADLVEIQKAGQRAASLTQQLLAYSRKQVLQPKDVDLNDTVSSLRGMLARLIREHTTLKCELSPEPAFVKIDPTQLEQVILNLVMNARDAMSSGGEIRVEVARVHLSEVDLPSDHSTHAREFVRLRISDTGDGIPPKSARTCSSRSTPRRSSARAPGSASPPSTVSCARATGSSAWKASPGAERLYDAFPGRRARSRFGRGSRCPRPTGHETMLLVEDDDCGARDYRRQCCGVRAIRVLEASTPHVACEHLRAHARATSTCC